MKTKPGRKQRNRKAAAHVLRARVKPTTRNLRRLRIKIRLEELERSRALRETVLALTRGNEALRASDEALWKRYEDMRRKYGALINAYDVVLGAWQKCRGIAQRSCDLLNGIREIRPKDRQTLATVIEALQREASPPKPRESFTCAQPTGENRGWRVESGGWRVPEDFH